MQGISSYHPLKDQVKASDSGKVSTTVEMLKQCHVQLNNQVTEMEQKVKKLEDQIAASYGIPEM